VALSDRNHGCHTEARSRTFAEDAKAHRPALARQGDVVHLKGQGSTATANEAHCKRSCPGFGLRSKGPSKLT
jgi:hypothetical protein